MEKKIKLVPVSKEVLDYFNQKIEKPLTPEQMMDEALKKLKQPTIMESANELMDNINLKLVNGNELNDDDLAMLFSSLFKITETIK